MSAVGWKAEPECGHGTVGPKRQGACINKLELVFEACIIRWPGIIMAKLTSSTVGF